MSIELEKKYRLSGGKRAEIESRLRNLGAVFEGDVFEENTVFSLLALTGNPAVLRIRRTREKTILTFKQRIASTTDIKQQMEYETGVSDAAATFEIVAALGLKPTLVYEKRRSTWQLGESEVVLDVLPFGEFMEIEGSIASIRDTEMLLHLEQADVEPRTYPNLAAEKGRRVGETVECRFTDHKDIDLK